MKALKCEMCGSNDVVKQEELFVCQNCGTKYTIEDARKMMVEGTVKVDASDELKNLYELARRAKDIDNSENALKYYGMILIKDPNSWEANYFVDYYKLMYCRIGELWSVAKKMVACQKQVLNMIKEGVNNPMDQFNAIEEIFERNKKVVTVYFNSANTDKKSQFQQKQTLTCIEILYAFGDSIVDLFEEGCVKYAIGSWKLGNEMYSELIKYLDRPNDVERGSLIIKKYGEKIQTYDSSYIIPKYSKKGSSGCYVATAVYGSYNCPEVWTLRRFRDNALDATWYGRAFIQSYYAISPILVRWFGKTTWFKRLWRKPLDKLVEKLKSNGVEDTPYQDKY